MAARRSEQLYGIEQPSMILDMNGKPDPYCFTAECMEHSDSCTALNGRAYMALAFTFIEIFMIACLFFFGIYLMIGLKTNKAGLLNVPGTTLINATLALVFTLVWAISYPIMILGKTFFWLDDIGIPVGLAFMAVFATIGFLNLALMWLEVAFASKTMKKTGANLSKKPLIFVCAFSTFSFLLILVLMTIMRSYMIGGGCAVIIIIAVAVIYLVGARELDLVMSSGSKGPKSPRLLKIISTARQMFACMMIFVVSDLIFAVSGTWRSVRGTAPQWLHVIGISLILLSLIVSLGILIEYVRDSTLVKRGFKRKAGSKNVTATGNTTTTTTA